MLRAEEARFVHSGRLRTPWPWTWPPSRGAERDSVVARYPGEVLGWATIWRWPAVQGTVPARGRHHRSRGR